MKITRTDRLILAALDEQGDMIPADIAEHIGLENHGWTGRKLRRLLAGELVRVSRWERNTDGQAIPVYSVTPGKSAPKPKAEGWAKWSKRYRKNLAERGGEQYLKARNSLALLVGITGGRRIADELKGGEQG